MKRLITTIVWGTFALTPVFAQQKNNGMIIFLDHSSSAKTVAQFNESEKLILRKRLSTHLQKNGDFVIISFLYGNSSALNNQKRYSFDFKEPSLEGLSKHEAELKKSMNVGLKRRYKSSLIKRILKETQVDIPQSNTSHILESLVLIKRVSANSSSLKVVYFSDMQEYSKYRHFETIKSASSAEKSAHSDLIKLFKDYSLSKVRIPASIECVIPTETMDGSESMRYLDSYWNTIFNSFFQSPRITYTTP